MLGAFWVGIATSSSLIIGAVLALLRPPGERTLGLIMAFGAGVLLSAVAYDLVLEAAEISGGPGITLGLAAGALVFFVGDRMIDEAGGGNRKAVRAKDAVGSPKAIVLGTVLDGVPESIVVGLTLLTGGGVSVALFAAVFLSNLPEAMAATSGLAETGVATTRILALWASVMIISGLAALAGYGLLGDAPPAAVAFVLAFAAGAVLTMLADTMMPEAFEHARREAGIATTLGFVVAFAIAQIERSG
jgi:ZIP family zinc transporter